MATTIWCPCLPRCSFFCQYAVTITATIALISSGMHFGWPSPSLPLLLHEDAEIKITPTEGSWLAVMPSTGAAFGAVIGGILVDIIGRKWCILILSPAYFVGWITIAMANTVNYFYVCRFVVGIADGIAFTVCPMYIGEIANSKIRGVLLSSVQVTTILGLLLINSIGLHCSIKVTAFISAVLPMLHFSTFIWMPESPYFLIMKGKLEKAVSSLKTLNHVTSIDYEVARISSAIEENRQTSHSFRELLRQSSNRNALFMVCVLRILQQFTGNIAIAFYCQMIFLEAGGIVTASTSTLIYFSGQLIIAAISSFFIDKTGRKPLLIISTIGSGITLTIEGVYFYCRNETTIDLSSFTFVPMAALLVYIIMYNIGLSTIPTVFLGEVFPTSIKGFALCVADIVFSIAVAVISKFFQITKDAFGMHVPFFSFALGCSVLLLFIIFFVPETKGKTLEEVQLIFKGKNTVLPSDKLLYSSANDTTLLLENAQISYST